MIGASIYVCSSCFPLSKPCTGKLSALNRRNDVTAKCGIGWSPGTPEGVTRRPKPSKEGQRSEAERKTRWLKAERRGSETKALLINQTVQGFDILVLVSKTV